MHLYQDCFKEFQNYFWRAFLYKFFSDEILYTLKSYILAFRLIEKYQNATLTG